MLQSGANVPRASSWEETLAIHQEADWTHKCRDKEQEHCSQIDPLSCNHQVDARDTNRLPVFGTMLVEVRFLRREDCAPDEEEDPVPDEGDRDVVV